MDLWKELVPYRKNGLIFKYKMDEVQTIPRHPLLWSCIYCILTKDTDYFQEIANRYSSEPGLLSVESNATLDALDYVAFCSAASQLDYSQAMCVANYGANTKVKLAGPFYLRYFYNNINPGRRFLGLVSYSVTEVKEKVRGPDGKVKILTKAYTDHEHEPKDKRINWDAWLGRHQWLIAHMQFCAWKKPNLIRKILWCRQLLRISKFNYLNGLTSWLMINDEARKSRICRFAIARWEKRNVSIDFCVRALLGVVNGTPSRPIITCDHPLATYIKLRKE